MSALKRKLIALTLLVILPTCLFIAVVGILAWLGYLQAEEPQEFEATMAQLLGDQVVVSYEVARTDWQSVDDYGYQESVESVVQPFTMTYWNGNTVTVTVPGHVWENAVKASQKLPWCDPRLVVALAHSESPHFTNHAKENEAGAMGTMQALLGTWNDMWKKIFSEYPNIWPTNTVPDRTNEEASMLFGCVYLKTTGSINALVAGKSVFTYFFAENPPVWNQHPPQARYVYDLYHELEKRLVVPTTFKTKGSQPFQVKEKQVIPLKKLVIDLFIDIHLLPKSVYAYEDNVGQLEESSESIVAVGTEGCVPLLDSYQVGPRGYHTGCEDWNRDGIPDCVASPTIKGWDYLAQDGKPYHAPLSGQIVQSGTDTYGNTWMFYKFSNGYSMGIMHLHFPSLSVGSSFKVGGIIGFVGSIGLSSEAHGHVWLLDENGRNLRDHKELFCK